MRFMISDTAYSSKRVWIETDEYGMIGPAFDDMKAFSIWGGTDKRGGNYASWEIAPDMMPVVRSRLTEYGFKEAEFQPD